MYRWIAGFLLLAGCSAENVVRTEDTTHDAWVDVAIPDIPTWDLSGVDAPVVSAPVVTLETYPRVDGSTSNLPLARLIACELLGVPWRWEYGPFTGESQSTEKTVAPAPENAEQQVLADGILAKIQHTKTHQSYVNLIDGTRDLILVASDPSTEEQAYAVEKGVTLDWTPLALDALVFVDNLQNTVTGLTTDQILSIFLGEITNWKNVGGPDQGILPYVRPANSGSQELMQDLVLKDRTMPAWPEDQVVAGMGGLIDEIKSGPWAIGYSVYYYVTYQYSIGGMRILAVDGVLPNALTLADGSYPHVAPVYIVTRSDLDPASTAGQLRAWLLAPGGQAAVARSGYVPILAGH